MNIEQMREIAEATFRRQFGDVDIVRVNVRRGIDFEDDTPIVDVHIIYDDESGQVTGHGLVRTRTEVIDKTWRDGKDDLGYPYVRFVAKSGLGQRDPAAVGCRGCTRLTKERNEWAR